MRRRTVLTHGIASLLAVCGGCLGAPGTGDDGGDATRTATTDPTSGTTARTESTPAATTETPRPTPSPADPIAVVVFNEMDVPLTVTLAVSSSRETLTERRIQLQPGSHREADTGITETGDYTVDVTVDDRPTGTYPLHIEGYDVRMGSNMIVSVYEDDVRVMVEE